MGLLMLGVINMKVNMMNIGFIGERATGWELDFIILCAAVCILFTGPDTISLERMITDRTSGAR